MHVHVLSVECVPFIQLHPKRSALDLLFIFTYGKAAAEQN